MSSVTEAIGLHLDRESLAIARATEVSVVPVLVATERQAADATVMGARRILDALRARLAPPPETGARAVSAVPADFDAPAISRLAQVCRKVGFEDVAYVDAAALTLAIAPRLDAAVVLQLGWRDLLVSRVRAAGASCAREATWLYPNVSLTNVQDRWVESIAAAMVKQTRFDPLHDQQGEQQLFAQLPQVLAAVTDRGSARIEVTAADNTFVVELTARLLEEAAAASYQTVIDALMGAQQASEPLDCIVPQTVARWPGFLARLAAAVPARVWTLPTGLLAQTAQSLVGVLQTDQAVWRVDRSAVPPALSELELHDGPQSTATVAPVTHVVLDGESLSLTDRPMIVGRLVGGDAPAIVVPEPAPGVSRRHCTLIRTDQGCRVIDHSTHGTWLNGRRVVTAADAHPGDRLRIGVPGVELTLISTAAAEDGAAQA